MKIIISVYIAGISYREEQMSSVICFFIIWRCNQAWFYSSKGPVIHSLSKTETDD